MGIIAAVTPVVKSSAVIPRIKNSSEDIAAVGKIDLYYSKPDREALSGIGVSFTSSTNGERHDI